MDKMNIELPKGAYIVLPDEQKDTTVGGIILGEENIKPPTEGVIVYAADDLKDMVGKRIRFRGSFAEFIEIEDVVHMFFRDLNSSIYYVIKDD